MPNCGIAGAPTWWDGGITSASPRSAGPSPSDDPLDVDFYDPDHSYGEHRYIIIGKSQQGRLLLVSYTERGDVIRLISARKQHERSRKLMNKVEAATEDELRSEYDLESLQVRKVGPGRKGFGDLVRLEPDTLQKLFQMLRP